MKRLLIALAFVAALTAGAMAQQNRDTIHFPVTITTGNTFQQALPHNFRWSLTIENNNASDSCWVYPGSGSATKATSALLLPGGTFQRYEAYIPSDAFQVTCATTGDTLYVTTQ